MKIITLFFISFSILIANNNSMKLDANTSVIVNGTKILKSDVDRGISALFPQRYYHGSISDEKMDEFRKDVQDKLIEQELLFQYAKSLGMKASVKDVNDTIKKLKEYLQTPENLNLTLERSGLSIEALKKTLYKEFLLKKLHEEKIETKLSEEELKEYYEKNKYKFKEPERIRARIIYVRNDPTDPNGKEKAKDRVKEAYEKIKSGDDFADIAAKYSTAMSRINGGDLGYLHKGMLEPNVEKVAYSMESNTTSDIIEEDIGFFIVKVESKTKPNQLSFEAVKDGLVKDLKKKYEEEKKSKILEEMMSTAVIIK